MGLVILAVGAAGVADATTGHPVLLGKGNSASKTTTIKSSHGPALSLSAPSGQAPLRVNSKKQVSKLNASLLGGKSEAQIVAAGGHVTAVEAEMSDGIGVATCPSGAHPIGGGVLPDPTDATDLPVIAGSFPHITGETFDGWEAIAADGNDTYNGGGFVFAYCTSGKVSVTAQAAATARRLQTTLPDQVRRQRQAARAHSIR
jgi:hypothetical protein